MCMWKKRENPPNKWEEKIGYNFNEEFALYFSIYGEKELTHSKLPKFWSRLKNKRKPKNIPKQSFETYNAWERYVMERYSCYDEEILIEFQHYLEFKESTSEITDNIWGALVLPIAVAIITSTLSGITLTGISIYGKIILIIVLWGFVRGIFKWIFNIILNSSLEVGRHKNFFQEYKKIIHKICEIQSKRQEDFDVIL